MGSSPIGGIKILYIYINNMCFLYACNLFFRLYDCCIYHIKKYKEDRKEAEEMQSLLNENPYYALE
jgi:hypothetical protein